MRFDPFALFAIILFVVMLGFLVNNFEITGFTGGVVQDMPVKKVLITPKPGVDAAALKASVNLRYEFDDKFSAEISEDDVYELSQYAYLEELNVYEIAEMPEPPTCNDGICGPGEPHFCPRDCPDVTKLDCYPVDHPLYGQVPWNIPLVKGPVAPPMNSVDVAVLDTGVNVEHPDLKFVVTECKDFTKPDLEGTCYDDHSHGTHVIGTVAADAGKYKLGIYGVAPGAKVHAYKVCDYRGYCWDDDIAAAIYFAAKKNIEIISMSLGDSQPSPILEQAINYAVSRGTLVIASAGNSGPGYNTVMYPAKYPTVIAVGSVDRLKNPSYFSSRGPELELAAPGSSVYSTWFTGCYGFKSGTSMSAPHVAGVAAVVWQGNGESTRQYLRNTALDIYTPGWDPVTGYGLVQIVQPAAASCPGCAKKAR